MSFINVDASVAMKFKRLKSCETILAVDPSIGSTGWALSSGNELIDSGQAEMNEAISRIDKAIDANRIFLNCIIVEDPFFIGSGNTWKLAWSAGGLSYAFRQYMANDCVQWNPKPMQWRSVLGLNVSEERNEKGKKKRDRETIDALVYDFCQKQTGLQLTTTNGKIQSDRCMALGMLFAARRLAKYFVSR